LVSETTQNDYRKAVEAEPLNDQEISEAIYAAKEAKRTARLKQEYFDRIKSQPVYIQYTAKDLWTKLRESVTPDGRRYVIDEDNQDQIRALCLYFSNDERFETELGFNLDKGLLLMGGIGIGKTYLMSFFFKNQHRSYVMRTARQIENLWIHQSKEENIIEELSRPIIASVNSDPFGHQTLGVCFDDLGTETIPSKKYGEEKNVMAEVILARYENKIPFDFTHFTTNLTAGDIEKAYGDRVRDRLRETCNVISFSATSKSRRK
jgi:DNA replication protein DnaC